MRHGMTGDAVQHGWRPLHRYASRVRARNVTRVTARMKPGCDERATSGAKGPLPGPKWMRPRDGIARQCNDAPRRSRGAEEEPACGGAAMPGFDGSAYAASAVSAPKLPPSASALLTACSDSCGANSWMKACA